MGKLVALFACVLFACAAQVAAGDVDLVFPPLNPGGVPKLMMFIPGGKVPNVNYTDTALAIQRATPGVSLWVVVPAVFERLCIIQCEAKGFCFALKSATESALAKAVKAGFVMTDKSKDVFIAGHSLGGTCANYLVQGNTGEYAGLIIMGGYVDSKGTGTLVNYQAPVILIGAELDGGLAKPGNMAPYFKQYEQVLANKGEDVAVRTASVVIIPQIDHSDFCPGYAVPGDLPSEVDSATALGKIGPTVAAFLNLHTGQSISVQAAAKKFLLNGISYSRSLLTPMIKALEYEVNSGEGIVFGGTTSPWCTIAQHKIAGLSVADDAKVTVHNVYTNESTSFEHTRVGYAMNAGRLILNTSSHNKYPTDLSDTAVSITANEVGCKLVSQDRIEQQLGVTAVTKGVTCGDINKYAVELVKSMLTPTSLRRFQAEGRGFCWKKDFQPYGDIGPLFIYESLELKENATCLSVASLTIDTTVDSKIFPGVHYCKLLSPAKVVDWMMTDSLKTDSSTSYSLAANKTNKGNAFNYFTSALQMAKSQKSVKEVNDMMRATT